MINLLSLRPCQFVLGLTEVQAKVKKIKGMTPKQRKKYIKDHCIPVVKANGKLYVIDHHHFVRACWETGIKKVHVHIIADRGAVSSKQFWKFMTAHDWAYLIDQFGTGPRDPKHLPMDIRGMADDPYRSLAWAAREAGAFTKVAIPFSEFKWANYYRNAISIDELREDFVSAVKKAVAISRSPKTSKLPGVLGK